MNFVKLVFLSFCLKYKVPYKIERPLCPIFSNISEFLLFKIGTPCICVSVSSSNYGIIYDFLFSIWSLQWILTDEHLICDLYKIALVFYINKWEYRLFKLCGDMFSKIKPNKTYIYSLCSSSPFQLLDYRYSKMLENTGYAMHKNNVLFRRCISSRINEYRSERLKSFS